MGWWPCAGCGDICTYDASDGTQYADTFGGSLDSGWGATAGVAWLIDTGRLYIPPFVALERVLYRTIELDCELDEFIFEVDVYDNTAGQWGLIVLDNTFTPLTVRFRLYCSFGSTTYSYLGPTGNGSVQGTAPSDGDKLSIKIKRTSTGQYTVCFYHEETLLAQQSGGWTSPDTFYPGIQINTIGGRANKGSFDNYTSEIHLLPCIAQEAPAATQSATGSLGAVPCTHCSDTPKTMILDVNVFSDGNVVCNDLNGRWQLNQDGSDPCKWKTSTAFSDNEFHFEAVVGASTITSKIRAVNKCNDEDGYEYTWLHTRGGDDCDALCAVLTFDNQANAPDWSDCDAGHVDKACNVSDADLVLDSGGCAGLMAQTCPVETQSATGIVSDADITGAASQTETPSTQALTGAVLVAGAAVQTETPATQSASGAVLVSGSIVQTSPVGTQSASGIGTVTGTITQTCPAATQVVAGTVAITGAISHVCPTSTQAATGTVSSGAITGTAAQTAPTATQSLAGFVQISGSASQTAVVAVQSLIGAVQISGSIVMTETSATQTASGGVEVAGTITQTCPVETQSGSGSVAIDGDIAQTCPPEEQTLSGATCSNFDCIYTCQVGGGAWTVTEDNCFATSCTCGPGPPDEECLEGVNEGEERRVDCEEL